MYAAAHSYSQWLMGVGAKRNSSGDLPPKIETGFPLYRRQSGSRWVGLDWCGEQKIS
jgi:hypothetical protein